MEAARVVVVTGSTRGLGLAAARAFLEAGDAVVLNGRSAADAPEALRALVVEADASTEAGVDALLDAARARHGRVDVVIANAGIADPTSPFHEATAAELGAVLATNLLGPLLLARALLARGVGARLVVVGSRAAATPEARSVAYAATKAGLEGMIRALAEEVRADRLAACGLRPASLRTELTRARVDPAAFAVLPEPDATARALVALTEAPAAAVHGRVFDAERLRAAPFSELVAAGPRATWPEFAPAEREWVPPASSRVSAVAPTYPDDARLRAAIAARLDRDEAEIVVGAGATELLFRVLDTLTGVGERVVVSDPSWAPFAARARMRERRVVPIPMRLGPAAARHDLDAIAAAAGRARLVYVDSPNHPTGAMLDPGGLSALLDALPPHVPLVVDEAWIEFASDAAARAVTVRDERLIVVRTFSKAHGLASLRVAYAVVGARAASLLRRAGHPYAVGGDALASAERALGDDAHLAHTIESARAARHRLVTHLEGRGARTLRSEAPFLLAEAAAVEALGLRTLSERRYFEDRFVALDVDALG
ncbi:MAG: SDR family NAD(P)-dependent oxidoreductase [Sandaracinaceae bacterium]|nr:SDR family NAD(P)-dependent oxidoreductase [Sandaracinaceae bacterium]